MNVERQQNRNYNKKKHVSICHTKFDLLTILCFPSHSTNNFFPPLPNTFISGSRELRCTMDLIDRKKSTREFDAIIYLKIITFS